MIRKINWIRKDSQIYIDRFLKIMSMNEKSAYTDLVSAIEAYRISPDYKWMLKAQDHLDDTREIEGLMTSVKVPMGNRADGSVIYKTVTWKPEIEIMSNFFVRALSQVITKAMGNGIESEYKELLGDDVDEVIRDALMNAGAHRVSYIYYNGSGIEKISALEGLPVINEIGEMVAFVRFYRFFETSPWVIEVYDANFLYKFFNKGEEVTREVVPLLANVTNYGDLGEEVDVIGYSRVPVFPLLFNRRGMSELTRAVASQQDAYDRLKTTKGDEFLKTQAINFQIVGGDATAEELIMIRDLSQKLGLAPMSAGVGAEGKMSMSVAEYPINPVMEQLREYENGIFRDMEVTNVNAITVGSVTATAIVEARKSELKKAKEVTNQVIYTFNQILKLIGIENPDVKLDIWEDADETAIVERRYTEARALALWSQSGIPFVEQVRMASEWSDEDKERIIRTYHEQMLGYDGEEL